MACWRESLFRSDGAQRRKRRRALPAAAPIALWSLEHGLLCNVAAPVPDAAKLSLATGSPWPTAGTHNRQLTGTLRKV